MIYYLFTSLVLQHMLQVTMTSFDSVGAAALNVFDVCDFNSYVFSRRRHSQNRRVENAPFIESFMVISLTDVKKISTACVEGYTVVIIVISKVFKGV